ncbi:hypothetical protein ACFOYU_11775 [Microvirga sp. GCM10011540]|uniref:hypothetical protein n=1 Tax=Microvirga sp. GCM10011540 TaxID=3317338 RepID=UPI003614A2C3
MTDLYDTAETETAEKGVKPAMEVIQPSRLPHLQTPPADWAGAPPRAPRVDHRKLGGVMTMRLSGDLRCGLQAAAKAEGITESALVRRLILDRLGLESDADRASGRRPRIPDQDLQVLAGLVREVGSLYGPARSQPPKIDKIIGGLDRLRAALVPMVARAGRDV